MTKPTKTNKRTKTTRRKRSRYEEEGLFQPIQAIPDDEASIALGKPFADIGFSLEGAALDAAVKATAGYAYIVQLVGYSVWKVARRHRDESSVVTSQDVDEGVSLALADYASRHRARLGSPV